MASSDYRSTGSAARTLGVLVLLASCSACVSSQHLAPQPAPMFDPAAFFTGATKGDGVLKIAFHRPKHVAVTGQGRVESDGTLVLAQTVDSDPGLPKMRTWRLHRAAPGRWAGTLSDAAGPVAAEVTGNLFHIAFAMSGGLQAQQWLYLQAGGTTVRNVMVVSKVGLPVARLDETITRQPGAAADRAGQ